MKEKDYNDMIQTCLQNIRNSSSKKEQEFWKQKLKYWQDRKKVSK